MREISPCCDTPRFQCATASLGPDSVLTESDPACDRNLPQKQNAIRSWCKFSRPTFYFQVKGPESESGIWTLLVSEPLVKLKGLCLFSAVILLRPLTSANELKTLTRFLCVIPAHLLNKTRKCRGCHLHRHYTFSVVVRM